MLTAIDHVILPVASLDEAAAPLERLGLSLTPRTRHAGQGTENRACFVGSETSEFYVELLAVHDAGEARAAGRGDLLDALDSPPALWRVMLESDDLAAHARALERAGIAASPREITREGGAKICDALLFGETPAGCGLSMLNYVELPGARAKRHHAEGVHNTALGLKRIDHLAAIVHDAGRAVRFWNDVLDVPVHGEIAMGAGVIYQMKIGDAILELIGPATADSPMHQRPEGLISMCAFEVAGLDAAVESARAAGFTCPDGAPGPLPGTRVASVPGAELSGLTLQLLEYV